MKQETSSPYETQTKGYSLFNVGFNTEIKLSNQLMNVGVLVNNVFDKKYFAHLSTLKSLNYFNQGRNVSAVMKIPFGIK